MSRDPIRDVIMAKAFHLYVRRNEWINWRGDTDLVDHTSLEVFLSFDQARYASERQRSQGTRFLIDEIPVILLEGCSRYLLIAELFNNRPIRQCLPKCAPAEEPRTIGEVVRMLRQSRWNVLRPTAITPITRDINSYARLTSSSSGQHRALEWNAVPNPRMDDTDMKQLYRMLGGVEEMLGAIARLKP